MTRQSLRSGQGPRLIPTWPQPWRSSPRVAVTDATCGLRLGRYSRSQDHDEAADLLKTVDLPDHTLPAKLRRVLASKDKVPYCPRLVSKTEARALVPQARVLVDAAEQR